MGLGISIQDRLSKLPLYTSDRYCVITRLVRNYRSNEALLTVPSSLFYGGSLQCSAPTEVTDPFADLGALGPAGFPLLLCNVPHGKECSKLDTPSFYNLEECRAVMVLARGLLSCQCKDGVEPLHTGQICVITPFRAQVLALRKLLRGSNLGGINVGVVEDFQGQEAKVVFISTALTQDHPRWNRSVAPSGVDEPDGVEQRFGFLHDPKKFNVAITRAHALCVVVGNADYLAQSGSYWSVLLDHIRRNDGVLGEEEDHSEYGKANHSLNEDDLYGVGDLLRRVEELKLLGSGAEENMHDLSYYYSDAPQWKVMLS
jgi:helicase MOV-10